MSPSPLASKNIAILLCSGFEEQSFVKLQQGLMKAGAQVKVVSRDNGLTNGWAGKDWGLSYSVDAALAETLAIDFDVMVIPTGYRHTDMLLNDPHGMRVVSAFLRENTPCLVIGTGVEALLSKDLFEGRDIPADGIQLDKTLVTAPAEADTAEMIIALEQAVVATDAVEVAA
jgi:protease I